MTQLVGQKRKGGLILGSKKKSIYDDASGDMDIMSTFDISGQGTGMKKSKSKNHIDNTGVDAGI